MVVIPLCCPRLVSIDGGFVQDQGDRRMRFLGGQNNWRWTCMQCMRELHLEDLPLMVDACTQHQMALVIDGEHQYYTCCALYHEDVPLGIAHHIVVQEHRPALNNVEVDLMHIDLVGRANDMGEQAEVLQNLLSTYDTIEEELTLEAMLHDYSP
jgi:hypothetical protein